MAFEAERRLLIAMLQDAIDVLLAQGLAPPGTFRSDSERWIISNDRKAPFSFVNVCETLLVDPMAVREEILTKLRAQAAHRKSQRRNKRAAA